MNLPERFRAEDGLLDGARCVFVVGAPRSGTTWLQHMIEAHPMVASIPQELTLFSRYVDPIVRGYDLEHANIAQERWKQGLPLLVDQQEFGRAVRSVLTSLYGRVLARNPEALVLLDKHPGYSHHLALIERFLPGSRIIHLIRDGREVAVSMLSAKQRIGFGAATIQGCAKEWCTSVIDARAYGNAAGPGRYLEVRYEHLATGAEQELGRIFAFCGLEVRPELVAEIVRKHHIGQKAVSMGDPRMRRLREARGDSWSTLLDLPQRYWFDRIAGDQLRDLGYAVRGWWAFSFWHSIAMAVYPMRIRLGESWRSLMRIWGTPIARSIRPSRTRSVSCGR